MSSKYAQLVEKAEQQRQRYAQDASLSKALNVIAAEGLVQRDMFAPYVHELEAVNKCISVEPEKIEEASQAYDKIAELLVSKLKWKNEDIRICPQGSASTQTLIRSPTREKFDIDAVCKVDISRVAASAPTSFFEAVGTALEGLNAERKNRCWRINESGTTYYIEFTPSVPLASVSTEIKSEMGLRRTPVLDYKETALAVVDNATTSWKTSNPEGMTKWVNDVSDRRLVRQLKLAAEAMAYATDSIQPVAEQEVELSDTLRIAIRLFKRHRDMYAKRGIIDSDAKPISIIIVTLLTSCYAGLADQGREYEHPFQLLMDLAELMPHMVEIIDGEYWVANPTVEGENFAERWNTDDGERQRTFTIWTDLLRGDLQTILACRNDADIRDQVRKIFGCIGASGLPGGDDGGENGGTSRIQSKPPAPAVRTSGLA